MPPIRRYLRITPHSVIETRIHLTDPYQSRWLPTVLPRIFTSIKPHVFGQLREERVRQSSTSSKKRKVVKDVVIEEDFEVSIFLTEGGTRHNLLVKQKGFGQVGGGLSGTKRRKGKAGNLTKWLEREPEGSGPAPGDAEAEDGIQIRVESDDENENASTGLRQYEEISDDEGFERTQARTGSSEDKADSDDKKKLALDLSYDGFAIYGKVLCLVVKRRGPGAKRKAFGDGGATPSTTTDTSGVQRGKAMLETWVSTQAQAQADGESTLIED